MDEVFSSLALTATGLGVLLALGHLVASAVFVLRKNLERPELVPIGYTGVGLLVGSVAFYLLRGVADGKWGGVQDLAGLVVVLAVASLGFGAGYEWLQRLPGRARIPAGAPLLLSLVTGGLLGVAASNLGV